jgi:hypothetical protein
MGRITEDALPISAWEKVEGKLYNFALSWINVIIGFSDTGCELFIPISCRGSVFCE